MTHNNNHGYILGFRIRIQDNFVVPVIVKATHRKRLSLSSTGDEGEPLGLDGHPGALDMLLDIPENENIKI